MLSIFKDQINNIYFRP